MPQPYRPAKHICGILLGPPIGLVIAYTLSLFPDVLFRYMKHHGFGFWPTFSVFVIIYLFEIAVVLEILLTWANSDEIPKSNADILKEFE